MRPQRIGSDAVLCITFLVSCSYCLLSGGRLPDFPSPDFRKTVSLQAQEGRQSYAEVEHGLNEVPFLVRVHARARIGDSAGYRFEGVGACQNSGEKGNYGGLLFGYSANVVRLWAPSEYGGNRNGRIIYVGDGWGGEKYTESAVEADVTVEVWSSGPEPTFQTEVEVDTRRETFYEVVHGLNQIPDIVSVRVSSLHTSQDKAFFFHGVSSSQNPSEVRQYGGVIFSYSERTVRLWFADKGKKKGKTGCIVIGRGWGGGRKADELTTSTCRVEIRMWVNLFPDPVFQTDWIEMTASAHNETFLELPHNLNRLPLYVLVQARVTVTGTGEIKDNFIFEGTGSVQATQFSRENSYGGVVFAYNDKSVRIWVPTSESTADGKIVLVSDGWGDRKMDMEFKKAEIRVKVHADRCDKATEKVDSQGLCREASEIGLSLTLSNWEQCSSVCGKGKSRRYGTGCHGQSLRSVLKCHFEENECGFISEQSLDYRLQWKRTLGQVAKKNMGDKNAKSEPPYGYPRGSYFMYTATHEAQPGSIGILLSSPVANGNECVLRFFYTTGVYFGLFYLEVMTINRKWHEVWKVIDSQTGNPKAWYGAYIDIESMVEEDIVRLRFVHETPEKCGSSCGYVAIDHLHLECMSEERVLVPLGVCKAKETPFPGCPMKPSNIIQKGPAFSTVWTKEGLFIQAARNKSDLIAKYQFKVLHKEKYFLWVEGFGQSTSDNGVKVRIDNHETYFWNLIFKNDTPVWNVFTFGYTLEPGLHNITILQYESGFKFRNLMISPASLKSWSDLGMQSHHISDHMLTSSLYTMTLHEEAQFSRLHGLGGWWPRDENAGALYLQIRLPDLALINKLATQGGYSFDSSYRHYCHTESFKVKFSLDGKNYAYYRSLRNGKEYMFRGNSDPSTVKVHDLSYAVPARGVRFYPWKFPLYPCLRVELYGKYITRGMCDYLKTPKNLEKDCFGDRQCGQNAMCQRSEANNPGEEEQCRCISGYHGDKCQHAGCKPNPCLSGGVCQIHKGKFVCICPPGFTGKVCSQQCPENTYGIGCSKSCHCPGYSNCDHVTGACFCKPGYIGANCTTPCQQGYYGMACSMKCSCGSLPVCDHTSGSCYCPLGYYGKDCKSECPSFYFGKNCSERCQCVNDASCHGHNGQCVCKAGWRGQQCELPCPELTYGQKCLKVCNCPKNANCNHITGHCTCKAGWTGVNCSVPCPLGNYGVGCKQSCHCHWEHTQNCHAVTGACQCYPGYTGGNCSSMCPKGKFGPGCSQTCQCVNDATCDHVSGNCQCQIGYVGRFCEKRCPAGFYGEECKFKCRCIANQTEECDFKTGECNCRAGYRGTRCHKSCKPGTWGKNCDNMCHCLNNGTCEGVNGLCYCAPGWEGIMCEKECSPRYYGADCEHMCACKNDAYCDRFNGSCTCIPGFKGDFCEQSCKQGTYGPYCKFKCLCDKAWTESCDRSTGQCFCKLGRYGKKCEKECEDGFYGKGCNSRCFPCDHAHGPCNKETGACSCSPGFSGDRCEDECNDGYFGLQCKSMCRCPQDLTCNMIDGTCFQGSFATFYLAFYDRYNSINTVINRRLLERNVEKFMSKYFSPVILRRALNETSAVSGRERRDIGLFSYGEDFFSKFRQRRNAIGGNNNASTALDQHGNVFSIRESKLAKNSFVARIVNMRIVVDAEGREATEVGFIVFLNASPLNGSLCSVIFRAVSVNDVIDILRYRYFTGPVFERQMDKEPSSHLLWIISGVTGALIGLLLVIIFTTVYRRRQSSVPSIYKVKRNSKDYEMKPCLPGAGGHVLAFDNPYYDVIAAMGLDDDIEEDYHNPLYPPYDDSSYYGEGQESESGTEMPGEEIYHYPYDRDSGISSGTF